MDIASLKVIKDTKKGLDRLASSAEKTEQKITILDKAFSQTEKTAKALNRAFIGAGISGGIFEKKTSKATKTVKALNRAFKDAGITGGIFEKKMSKAANTVKEVVLETKTLRKSLKTTVEDVNNVSSSFDSLGEQFDSTIEKIKKIADCLNKTKEESKVLSEGFDELKKISGMAFDGVMKNVQSATKQTVDFQKAMAEVEKTVNFESPEGIIKMQEELEKLSTKIPMSFEELTGIAAKGGELKVAKEDLIGFTENVAKMGTVFDMSSNDVANSMTKISSLFASPISNIGELGDTITVLSNDVGTTAQSIIDFLLQSGSLAKSFKISENEAAAFGSAMVALGMQPKEASSGFNSMIMTLSNLDTMGKKGKKALDKLGLGTAEFANLAKQDGKEAIMELLNSLQGLNEVDRKSVLSDLFDEDTAKKVDTMVGGLSKVKEALEATKNTEGSMQINFQEDSNNIPDKLKLLESSIAVAQANIGDAFIPVLYSLLTAVNPLIEKFSEWANNNPDLILSIAAVVGGLSGLVLVAGGIASVITTVSTIMAALTFVAEALAVSIGGVVLTAGAIVVAIGALIAVGVLLYQNWDTIKEKADEIWMAIGEIVSIMVEDVKEKWASFNDAVGGTIYEIVESAKTKFNEMKDSITEAFDNLKSFVSNAMTAISEFISSKWDAIKTYFTDTMLAIKDAVEKGWSFVTSAISSAMNMIKEKIQTAWNIITTVVSTAINSVKSAVVNGFQNLISSAKNKIAEFIVAFGELKSNLLNIGRDAVQGLINGVKEKIQGAITVARDLASKVSSTITDFFIIKSPSRLMKKYGGYISEGLAIGIKDKSSEAQKEALNLAKSVVGAMKTLEKDIYMMGLDDDVNKALASFDYDVKKGKYDGLNQQTIDQHRELIKAKEDLIKVIERENKATKANENVSNTTAAINRRLDLGDDATGMQKLDYAIKNDITKQFEGVTPKNITALRQATASSDFKGMMKEITPELTENQKLQKVFDKRLGIIDAFEAAYTNKKEQAAEARKILSEQFETDRSMLMLKSYENTFSEVGSLTKMFVGEQSGIYRALFAVEKGFAIAKSALAIKQSIASAMSVGFPANLPLIGQAIAQGAQIVSDIKSITMPVGQAHDGIMSVPKSGTWNLEKGERVLPQHTAKTLDRKLAANDSSRSDSQNIGITINVDNSGNTQVSADNATQEAKQLANNIKAVVIDTIRKEKRQGGLLSA